MLKLLAEPSNVSFFYNRKSWVLHSIPISDIIFIQSIVNGMEAKKCIVREDNMTPSITVDNNNATYDFHHLYGSISGIPNLFVHLKKRYRYQGSKGVGCCYISIPHTTTEV